MCGICGIVDTHPIDRQAVGAMISSLRHRGPDASGIYVDGQVALGHARLKIIDLSADANQPMTNEDGSLQLVFNGEIYNHRELRDWLKQRGHTFRSRGDSEVLLHLYEERGEEMAQALNGMFAFALWDAHRRRLLLVRDRLGVKPLLYAVTDRGFLFGSELRAFLTHSSISRTLDPAALALYLTFRYIPAPYTILRDVRRLPPAHYGLVQIADGSVSFTTRRYWDLLTEVRRGEASEPSNSAEDALRETFDDAVRLRLESDVPLGAFLSGGIDSTLVVATAAHHLDGLKTFTVGFEGMPGYDERPYARAVAKHFHTAHQEIVLSSVQVRDLISEVVDRLDEPFGDSSLVPSFVVSRAARQSVTVALSGDGGDELFGGYEKYRGEAAARWLSGIPGLVNVLGRAAAMLPETRRTPLLERVTIAKRFLRGFSGDLTERHFNWTAIQGPAEIRSLLTPEAREFLRPWLAHGLHTLASLVGETQEWNDSINRILYADAMFVLPFNMLAKVDMASMLNSLEVRSPFLDFRLYPLALRIPGIHKVHLRSGKVLLKRIFRDRLPPLIRSRPKRGFGIPIGEWFKTDLRPLLMDTLGPQALSRGSLFDAQAVQQVIRAHFSGRRDQFRTLWMLLCLQRWSTGAGVSAL